MPANRESGETPARQTKGQKTRERIVQAAEHVFVAKGYLDTRVADIAKSAEVAHGSFYTYFSSKDEVFQAVAERVVDALYLALDGRVLGGTAEHRIREANRRYIDLYEEHAAMMALIEQVATFNPVFLEMRRHLRGQHVERIERAIRRIADQAGTPSTTLDPHVTANVLGGMVDNLCYWWFVMGEPFDRDMALHTLDEVWFRALGLDVPLLAEPEGVPGAA
jgi:AcrR family transcriptional regulator